MLLIKYVIPADPESKIRTAVGVAIANIARWEVPDIWPDLLGRCSDPKYYSLEMACVCVHVFVFCC